MPKYHCLDTEVQLYTSELVFHHALSELSDPAGQSPGSKHSLTIADSNFREDTPAFSGIHCVTRPFRGERLTEQRFKGHKCLEFLGLETPFFLICAGKDASNVTLSPPSFQSPTVLSSPYTLNLRSQRPEVHTDEQASIESTINLTSQNVSDLTSSAMSLEGPRRLAEHIRNPSENSKLDVLSKPIEIVVKLSESSFISPNFATETSRYDICVNIFYNGEFSASHIIKYSTLALNGGKTCVRLGGRRFATNRELPWKIDIKSESVCSSLNSSSKGLPVLTPDERWAKLMAALNVEANEWGRDERGNRCPTGKYLELVSEMAIPTELKRPLVGTGFGFGVIDVVITLGRFSYIDVSKEVVTSIRYLHTSQRQMAGNLSDQERRHKITTAVTASITDVSRSRPQSYNNSTSYPAETHPEIISGSPITNKKPHSVNMQSDHRGQNFSNSRDAFTPSLDLIPQNSTTRAFTKRTTPMNPNIPSSVAKALTTRPPHPHRPENVPQKRYRGSEPELPILPPPKRRGKAKAFEELPIDLAAATYMSTRAKRNASISFAKTLLNEEEVPSITRQNPFYPPKNISDNSESLETTAAKPSLAPKKRFSKNPQTPVFGGYLKRNARSSNYNPKLSNRPQNLRRKNSAGEWVIPPCRKNSSGEWETPTKGGQVKNSGFQKSRNSESIPGENEEIFQPVFGISTDNNRYIEIKPRIPSKVSSSSQKRTMNGKTGPAKVSEQLGKSLIPAMLNAIKEEHMISSNEAGQSTEIANPASANHVMDFNSNNLIERASDNLENEELEIRPSQATKTLETYFIGLNEDGTVIENKSSPKKKSLRMRFFQSDTSCGGEMADRKHSATRWLVERCVSSGYTLGKDFTEKLVPQSLSREKLDRPLDLTNIRRGETLIDVIKHPAPRETAKLHFEFINKESRRQTTTSNQYNTVASSQENRNLDTNQQQLVVANGNSRTLKLVRRRGIATTGDEINYNAQASIGQAPMSYRPNNIILGNHGDKKEDGSPSAFETYGNYSKCAHQDSDLFSSVAPLSVKGTSTMFTAPSAMVKKQPGPETAKDMEAQSPWEDRAHTKTSAGTIYTERLFRPRTVGSTELKALLESHDRHSGIDTPPDTPLGMIESQLMTRPPRKAASLSPHKVIAQSRAITDKKPPHDNPALETYVTNKGSTRIRGSSGQFVQKPLITTSIQNRIVNADISQSKTVTTQAEGGTSLINVTDDIQNSFMRNSTPEEAETRSMTGKGYDLGANVGGSKVVAQPISNAMKLDEAAEEVDVALKQVLKAKKKIKKAARDFEFLKTHTSAPRNISVVNSERNSKTRTGEASRKDIPKIQEHNSLASTPFTQDATSWKPGYLCQDSILTYAGAENWPGMDMDPATGQVSRKIGKQEVGYFKASSVLMGVRYVVVGSAGVEALVNE